MAGWDGGGVSLQDAFKVRFVNNTVISNDTTASAGVLFKTLGSALASTPPPNCNPGSDPNAVVRRLDDDVDRPAVRVRDHAQYAQHGDGDGRDSRRRRGAGELPLGVRVHEQATSAGSCPCRS